MSRLLLITAFCVLATALYVRAESGMFIVRGELQACESAPTQFPCYRIGPNFYLNMDKEHSAMAGILAAAVGKEVVLTVAQTD